MIISAAYIASVLMASNHGYSISPLNPAAALAIDLVALISTKSASMEWIWLFPCMPFVGSILALLFFEFVYIKSVVETEMASSQGGSPHSSVIGDENNSLQ
eukprot:CAMPEP_0176385504 /NCGR_PEP_ID=MMETSP0126-20121128/35208_1 /TAXON_ID=141414 ORGANISM="Strombidinopsis acuminatum, Strain SPMC142" /NCGR_SAMPLE_ID=MMETSP0126 /ASSEMBLY_ACC=CAM_ASM_000229 /LENGTH=100 /DNA_ID=CAMNT_0017751915 /DNA_START=469 /DNA_END=771 /DNA_ORIENTATION=+